MVTLVQFPRSLGLPNPSPFCNKAELLMKESGIEFDVKFEFNPGKGPKGKLPAVWLDNGQLIGDSEMIRGELETLTGHDFDAGLSEEQRGQAHAICRMVEERLYWALVYSRWIDPAIAPTTRANIFSAVPGVIRGLVWAGAVRGVRKSLVGHGIGKHTQDEIYEFGCRDIAALSRILGDKDWLLGDQPCSADLTVWPYICTFSMPDVPDSPMARAVKADEKLLAYAARGWDRWYPDMKPAALA